MVFADGTSPKRRRDLGLGGITEGKSVMKKTSRLSGGVAAIIGVAGIAGCVVVATPAVADSIEIGLGLGGAITTVGLPSNGMSIVTEGGTNFAYNWSVTATGQPLASYPEILNSTAISVDYDPTGTGGGEQHCVGGTSGSCLYLYVTETGLTGTFPGFLSGLTVNEVPAGWSITETTAWDSGDTAFAMTTPLCSSTSTAIGTTQCGSPGNVGGGAYSVTEVFEFLAPTDAANGQTASLTEDIQATPLPSTWTMLIASLLGIGLFAYRGSKRRSQGVSMLGATTA